MATELEKKIKIRQGYRDLLTRRVADVDGLLRSMESASEFDCVKLGQIKMSLGEKFIALKKLDEDIIERTQDGAEVVREIGEADVFNEGVYEILARVEACFREPSGRGGVVARSGQGAGTKLPKLDLPRFSGEVTEWLTFWDSYQAAVHNNPSLLPVQKFTYLRSLVSKSAKEAIVGLALTDANYSEAVKLLEIRFGNKERIIAKHMDALLNLESVASNTNTGALRALYDKIEAHTRELKALGVAAEAYNCLLPSLLMKKLPNELCLTISRRVPEDEWKLDRIMSELSDELKARERTLPKSESGRGKEHKEHSSEHGYRRSRERPTSATLHTSVGTCCYCGSEHTPESCTKVDKPENRKSVLRDSGREPA